jgi:hypothetical protein
VSSCTNGETRQQGKHNAILSPSTICCSFYIPTKFLAYPMVTDMTKREDAYQTG